MSRFGVIFVDIFTQSSTDIGNSCYDYASKHK